MKILDRGVAFSTALQLDEILVHFGAQWCGGPFRMQGPAVNLTWFHVECHIVLQLDYDDTGM